MDTSMTTPARLAALLDACPEPDTPEEDEWLREHYPDWQREFDSEVLKLRQNGGNDGNET